MALMQRPADFKEFLRLLNAHRVEYLLIGGGMRSGIMAIRGQRGTWIFGLLAT